MARHDPHRTGLAKGTSDIKKPVPYWRRYLGGQVTASQLIAADANGNGDIEFIHVRAGRVVAKLANDELVWQTALLDVKALVGIDDLNDDGSLDIVAYASDRVHVIDGVSGAVLWSEPEGEMGTVGAVRVADLDGDGVSDLIIEECGCCGKNSGKTGFAYSFSKGFSSPTVLWTLPEIYCGSYRSLTVLAQPNGAPIVLHATYTTVSALDGASGKTLAVTSDITTWVAASSCRPTDIDGAGGEEALCSLNTGVPPNKGQRKLFLLSFSSTPQPVLKVEWSHDLAPDQGGDTTVVDPVSDLDLDGQKEVIAGGSAGGSWKTFIYRAKTGLLVAEIPGERPSGVLDPSAPVFLTTTATGALRGYRLTGSKATLSFELPDSKPFQGPSLELARRGDLTSGLVTSDLDGDGKEELLISSPTSPILRAFGVSSGVPTPIASASFPEAVELTAAWRFPSPTQTKNRFVVARNDGYLVTLDGALASTNDEAGRPGMMIRGYYAAGAWGDLRRTPVTGALGAEKTDRVVVQDSRGGLLLLDASQASLAVPPVEQWFKARSFAPNIVPGVSNGSPRVACLGRVESSGAGKYQARVLRPDGSQHWAQDVPADPLGDLVTGNFDGDGVADLALQWGSPSDVLLRTRALSGATGATLWDSTPVNPGAGRQVAGFAVADWDADGVDDVVYQAQPTRIISGGTGAELLAGGASESYFLPTVFDADQDGHTELILHGGLYPARMLSHDLKKVLWKGTDDDRPYPYGSVGECAGGSVFSEASLQYPARLKMTRMSGAGVGSSITRVLAQGQSFATEQAATSGGAKLGQLTSASTHSNLTGKSHPTVLVGSTDGHLYGMNPCNGELDFSVAFGDAVGESVFGDTDGDGRDEILVTVADGYLYGLKNEAATPPPFVWDIEPVQGSSSDIDDVETVSVLACRWGKVAGASAFQVAIVEEGAGYVTSPAWRDSGPNPELTLTGLALKNDTKYLCAVRTLGATGASPDVASDGVTVHHPDSPGAGDAAVDAPLPVDAGTAGAPSEDGGSQADDILSGRACTCTVVGRRPHGLPLAGWFACAFLAGLVRRGFRRSH